jgi:hypothetical protein
VSYETRNSIEIDVARRRHDSKKVAILALHQDTLSKVVLWNVTHVCCIGGVERALVSHNIIRTPAPIEVSL